MELVVAEDMRVLSVKAKHDADAKNIEPAQGFIGAVSILFLLVSAKTIGRWKKQAENSEEVPAFFVTFVSATKQE